MRTNEKAALLAALAELLLNEDEFEPQRPCRCHEPQFNEPQFRRPVTNFNREPRMPWGVCNCPPREDKNKVFGLHVEVDEPRRQDYWSRAQFERDHAKFDRLVEAAEACDWENKSNTAPKHRVNAIRRRIEDGPVIGLDLVGETQWW